MLHSELIPAADRGSRRLMIVLHGLGDSVEGYRWLPGALRLPWLNYCLVNAPDPYYGGYSWFDFAGDFGPGVLRSRGLLLKLFDQQRAAGYPTEETLLFGFSQGCLMILDAGLRYPHRFAGLIGISGWVHEVEKLMAELSPVAMQQRLLITHGTDDPIVPFAPVREQINQIKAEGLHVEWHEFVKPHTIAGEAELEVIREFILRTAGPQ